MSENKFNERQFREKMMAIADDQAIEWVQETTRKYVRLMAY